MDRRLIFIFFNLIGSLGLGIQDSDRVLAGRVRELSETLLQVEARSYLDIASVCQGRLTLESGVAISTSDQSAKTTVYFTPYQGNTIGLYSGAAWSLLGFTEKSISLGTLTSGKNYDVFAYDNSGTLALELSSAWTNDTTRADALTTTDGVSLKNGATTRRYLGTFRTASTTTTQDTLQYRWLWSQCGQVPRRLHYSASPAGYSYSTSSWREAAGASSTHLASFVLGDSAALVNLRTVLASVSAGGGYTQYTTGVGIDTTGTNSSTVFGTYSQHVEPSMSRYVGYPGLGFHSATVIERAGGAAVNIYPPIILAGQIGSLE